MKKFTLFLALAAFTVAANAQAPDKFVLAMESKLVQIDSNNSADTWKDMANAFERIGDAEKTQWLPYYYAAYATIQAGYASMPKDQGFGDNSSLLDPLTDKAESLLNKAELLSQENPEIYIVRKMVHGLRMMGNPMARYMTESPKAAAALEKAKALSPNNPRVFLLEGQDKFYTPEQFGGSKEEAKILFEKAIEQFNVFKPASSIAPNWGRPAAMYFLSQMK